MKRSLKKLRQSIDIPFEASSDLVHKENILGSLINMGMLVMVIYALPLILTRGWGSRQTISTLMLVALLVLAKWFVRRGLIRLTSLVLVTCGWAYITYLFVFLENGLRAPAYSLMVAFLITYTALLHGRMGAIALIALTLAINTAVVVAEMQGYYLTTPRIPHIAWVLLAQFIFFSAIALVVNRTVGNLNRSIVRVREEADERSKAEMEVRNLNAQLESAYATTLMGWSQALELRDKETQGHSRRVTALSLELARAIGVASQKELQDIYFGALLHDIGKMGIPDRILHKAGALTADEFEVVKQHPVHAYELLKDIDYLKDAVVIPYLHHEQWDGSGYPLGLRGEEIPLPARIFALADVWDALTSDRPYRPAMLRQEVEAHIRARAGTHFDPAVVDIFLEKVVTRFDGMALPQHRS